LSEGLRVIEGETSARLATELLPLTRAAWDVTP